MKSLDSANRKLIEDRKRNFVHAAKLQIGSCLNTTKTKLSADQARHTNIIVGCKSLDSPTMAAGTNQLESTGKILQVKESVVQEGPKALDIDKADHIARYGTCSAEMSSINKLLAKLNADQQRHSGHVAAVRIGIEDLKYRVEDCKMEPRTIRRSTESPASEMPSEPGSEDRFAVEVVGQLINDTASLNLCNPEKSLEKIKAQLEADRKRNLYNACAMHRVAIGLQNSELDATPMIQHEDRSTVSDCANSDNSEDLIPFEVLDQLILEAAHHDQLA